ncbi:MAG: hypothetical protein BGO31_03405 [Bacteroidetes bacterium 43-16]|nr:MAG: hypothetical protein BGO31_03405 [Bacteroidetes bacterium 43-16]
MTFEQQLDSLLDYIAKNEGISYYDLLAKNNQNSNFEKCYDKLKKDGYIQIENENKFFAMGVIITASGKLFYEKGGYLSISEYNRKILSNATSAKILGWITVGLTAIGVALTIAFNITEK